MWKEKRFLKDGKLTWRFSGITIALCLSGTEEKILPLRMALWQCENLGDEHIVGINSSGECRWLLNEALAVLRIY